MRLYAKEGVLTAGSIQMDYISFGSGAKPLVMIQGLNTRGIRGAGRSLAWMYRLFTREYTVYLFDRRQDLPGEISVRELAADTALAMDALHIRNAHVLGVSQGGMIAQYLAVDRPDLVSRMVLAVTLSRNNETVTETVANWIGMTERGEIRELIGDMAEKMYSDAYLRRYRPLLPLLTVLQKPKDPDRFITLAKACLTCNVYEDLSRITCPVLVIGARQDRIVGGHASVELAEKLGCSLYLYGDLGHAAYEEAKDFNQRVYDFLHSPSLS